MNNSVASLNEIQAPDLRERAGKLATLIESAEMLLNSKEWSTLREEEFDGELERLERILLTEAKKKPLDEGELYRLQGKIEVMKRYSLQHLVDKYRLELDSINRINPPGHAGYTA